MNEEFLYDNRLIEITIEKLDEAIDHPLSIYLIGGSAMLQAGSKTATKDIDLVLREKKELDSMILALRKIGFEHIEMQSQEELKRTSMHFQNSQGLKFDIFMKSIAGKLEFTESMRQRAISIARLRHLEINRLSNEDLFLLKSVSGRDVDLDDMSKLFQSGLNWEVVISELVLQAKVTGRVWTVIFLDTLYDLEKEYDLRCPRLKEISDLAQRQIS